MRESAQGGFKSADRYFRIREQPFQRPAVHVHGSVRAFPALSACAVSIVVALLECYGVVRDHAVDVSAGDHKAVFRFSETGEIAVRDRLSDHSDSTAEAFEHTGDYGYAERRVIDISVSRYTDKVQLFDVSFLHILPGYGQKRHRITPFFNEK